MLVDHDTIIERQRYIGDVTRASYVDGFTFLRFEEFKCGGQTHNVAIFRNDLFARALGLQPDRPQFTRALPRVTDIACEFVLVPGGRFQMGSSPEDDDGRDDDEGPQHEVNVSAFLLARTQCTQAVWDGVEDMKGIGFEHTRHWSGARRPMESVSWYGTQEFAQAVGLRLPSEAEWEYACRAGTTTRFCYGDDLYPDDYNWFRDNSPWETSPVGENRPNAFGLFDMHGNVWEWCKDRWHSSYDNAPIDGSAWMDGDSARRVLRGGCWFSSPEYCRSSMRNYDRVEFRGDCTGFRLAASIA